MRIIKIIAVILGLAGLAAGIRAGIARRKSRYATKGL
jgi:uncharacterized membrane protein YtjA (UPF0391 family)